VTTPSIITLWRQALVAFLEEAFSDEDVEVISGPRSGVSRDKVRIAVFWPGWQEDSGNPNFARPTMKIRFWPDRSKQPAADPKDPAPLEQAATDLMAALQTVQKPGDLVDGLYCRVATIVADDDPNEWGIEATLVSWTINPATIAP
jgi:hypothetical protein